MYEPIHEMFRRAAAQYAGRPAIESGGRQVTFRELERRAGRIAARLLSGGCEQGSLVCILAHQADQVVAAMLGTLQAGCAFVPLDLEFPTVRLQTILEEVDPKFWIVTAPNLQRLDDIWRKPGERTVITLDDADSEAAPLDETAPPAPPWDPDGLCYVYFTSGSTGRPKPIAGRLKAIDHFVRWEAETFGLGEGLRVGQLTSPAFDAFLRDVFLPLTVGGTICAPADRMSILDGRQLVDWIEHARLHLLHCTPSLFRTILSQDLTPDLFRELRFILLAGEPLLPADVRRWHGVFGERVQVVNLYGPSETTMVKFFYRVKPEDGYAPSIPIGQPMSGARAILLDEKGQPCPPGKLGEIYIRTPYRTLGYLGRPELTREVFVQNPLGDRSDDIVYRTGDLGRVREDGEFEIVGRRDQQVKIRGVRVELGPIEEVLRSHEAIADVAVVDREDTQGTRFLCAYFVAPQPLETNDLRDYLLQHLPPIMLPSVFVRMDALPRTLTGKLDRRLLPKPEQTDREYAPPRTPVEKTLCQLIAELLALPRVGVCDDFFQIGGHSLLATLLLSRIRSTFGVDLPLWELFQKPTPGEMSSAISRLQMEQVQEDEVSALISEIRDIPEESLDHLIDREAGWLEREQQG